MTRLSRHHDKLLGELATIERERAEVERSRGSAKRLDRLKVRERAVTGAIRRVRSQLGLPLDFESDWAVSDPIDRSGLIVRPGPTKRWGRVEEGLQGAERQRVRPVPVTTSDAADGESDGALSDLIRFAARYCGRRAAEEALASRPQPADEARVIGRLAARGYSSADSFDVARATVRCFVEEYRDHTLQADESGEADAERLERDACEAIAAAIRLVVSTRGLTVDEVAALGGLHLARPRPRPVRRVGRRPAVGCRAALRTGRDGRGDRAPRGRGVDVSAYPLDEQTW